MEEAVKAQLKTDKLYKDAMQDIEEVKTAKLKVEMEKHSLQNFLGTRDSEVVNSASFISHLQEELASVK